MADAQTIQQKLQVLRDNFAVDLPAKLNKIGSIWKNIQLSNSEKDMNDLIFFCHKLAGAGSSFGFKNVSEYARAIEQTVQHLQTQSTTNNATHWDEKSHSDIAILIDKLLSQKDTQADDEPLSIIKKIKSKKTENESLLIYIQERNRLVVDELTTKLKTYNFSTRNFSQLKDLEKTFNETPPNVLIIDTTLFNAQTKKLLIDLKKKYDFTIIHLADTSNFNERLEAVRIGVDYYYTKPIDISSIIDTLDSLSEKGIEVASKVLIVDDSVSTSQFYALSLKNVGINTKVVTDPLKVMNEVIEFKPELILLDLHMPKCSGLELAAVIRQQENYISTPIIFLSGETDIQKQLAALEIGADEFLSKPVNVNHLIAVVKNKIQRYRQLSTYMHNDSLTGLLNHSSILSVLDTEMSRAKREDSNVSYAMIDIDFFKNVNDSYGHHMGDMVIKSISRFLRQSLRITDSVGRYGGEEFVVILPGIDTSVAEKIIQKILDTFSKVEFIHFNHKFNVTFSCGITDYLTDHSANEMIEAADKALYQAKEAGRNCIKVASSKN